MAKKSGFLCKNNHFKPLSSTFLAIVMIMLISISSVSALNFDNTKSFDDKVGEYGKVTIKDWFGLLDLTELELKENTFICGLDCNATTEIIMHQDGVLIDDVRFLIQRKDGTWKKRLISEYTFYVDDVLYTLGDEVESGTYSVRLEGKKNPFENVDWQIISQGKLIDEWAEWGGTLNTDLTAYYSFDSGSDDYIVIDRVGSLYNGSMEGMDLGNWVTGKLGSAVSFDASETDNYVNLSTLPDGWWNISYGFWFKTDDLTVNDDYMIDMRNPAGGVPHVFFYSGIVNKLTFYGGADAHSDAGDIDDDAWHHIVGVLNDTGGVSIYVDGEFNKSVGGGYTGNTNLELVILGNGLPLSDGYWYDGEIDEMGIWNRTLTQAEITQLYNEGTGITYEEKTTTLDSPLDNSFVNTNENEFNCSVSGAGSLINMSLYHNETGTWELNQSVDITGASNSSNFTTTITSSSIWNCLACDDLSCDFASSNYTVILDDIIPDVNIVSPTTLEDYGLLGTNQTLSWIVIDDNFDSAWYNYNGTNFSLIGATNSTMFNLTLGRNLTFWVNDTAGNLNTTFYLWDYKVFEYNQTYTNPVISSSTYDFDITTYYNDTLFTNIIGYLIYDGASTTATKSGSGDNTIFTASKTIPLVSGTTQKNFSWNFTLTNSTGSTHYVTTINNTKNNTVQGITFILCNASYPVPYINFTFEDELLGTAVDGTFSGTFEYWSTGSSSTNIANYSFQNLTENPSYAFCVHPNSTSINLNMNSQYSGAGYSDRTYYLNNATLTNITSNITLYQLNDTDAVKFFINVKDGIEAFTGATVTISKLFVGEGIYKTTGIRETDDAGKFIEYLELDQSYRFAITRDGISYGVIEKTSNCASAPCEIDLQIEGALTNLWSGFNDYYAGNVQYSFRYNDTNKLASLIFVDTTGLAQYMRLEITETNLQNSTRYYVCNETLYSSSGTITCNMTGEGGDFTAKAYLSRSPEKFVDVWNFVINLIKDTLGMEGVLIALLLIITVALVGAWSPTAGIVLTSFSILMMKLLGFVAFGWTTVTLIFVLAIIIIVKVKQ